MRIAYDGSSDGELQGKTKTQARVKVGSAGVWGLMLSQIQREELWPWITTLGESLSLLVFSCPVHKMKVLKQTNSPLPPTTNAPRFYKKKTL